MLTWVLDVMPQRRAVRLEELFLPGASAAEATLVPAGASSAVLCHVNAGIVSAGCLGTHSSAVALAAVAVKCCNGSRFKAATLSVDEAGSAQATVRSSDPAHFRGRGGLQRGRVLTRHGLIAEAILNLAKKADCYTGRCGIRGRHRELATHLNCLLNW